MKTVRIGGGSAFFIDSAMAVPQLLKAGVDYIILDYLAEGAMGLLGRGKLADPKAGFPSDFMDVHIGPLTRWRWPKSCARGYQSLASISRCRSSMATT